MASITAYPQSFATNGQFYEFSNLGYIANDNNNYATVICQKKGSSEYSRLYCNNFNCSALPDNAVITGIKYECKMSIGSTVTVKLVDVIRYMTGSNHSTITQSGNPAIALNCNGSNESHSINLPFAWTAEMLKSGGLSFGTQFRGTTNLSSWSISSTKKKNTIKIYYIRAVIEYEIPKYYLDLNCWINGVHAGDISTVGKADVYINGSLVSNDCTDYYTQHEAGTTYRIDVSANTGWEITGLHEDSASLSGTINGTTNVEPEFSKIRCTVSVSGNGGTVTGGGTYDYGTQVTLTATPNAGYQFVRWSDGNTNPARTFTVTSDITLTAVFEAVQTKPEFTHASMTYGGHQVSQVNKVPAGQVCILAVGISNFN